MSDRMDVPTTQSAPLPSARRGSSAHPLRDSFSRRYKTPTMSTEIPAGHSAMSLQYRLIGLKARVDLLQQSRGLSTTLLKAQHKG